MAELVVAVPAIALAVYAHPDDPEVSCGGTLAHWATGGCEVHVVICCRGDKGTSDPAAAPDELSARRSDEVLAGCAALGVRDHHLLGYPDGELDDGPKLRGHLVELVRRLRPEV